MLSCTSFFFPQKTCISRPYCICINITIFPTLIESVLNSICYAIRISSWKLTKKLYRGSSLSTIFGILKKSYYSKIVLLGTTQLISTSTNFTTQQSHQYEFYTYSTKIRTSGNRTSGDRTSGGPPVPFKNRSYEVTVLIYNNTLCQCCFLE